MSDEKYKITDKGIAFTHYFFEARGDEQELSLDDALKDFDAKIYEPVKRDVLRQFVMDLTEGALEEAGESPETLTEEQVAEAEVLAGEAVFYLAEQFLLLDEALSEVEGHGGVE